MENVLQVINLAAVAFLWWFVRTHVAKRVEAQAKAYGELDAKVERLPELVAIQKEIRRGEAEVDILTQRTLARESLARTKRADFLEKQLTEFYWPIYWRLQKDNAVWERILARDKGDPNQQKIAWEIERAFLLPNHREMIGIIESHIHLAEADPDLEALLLTYVRHVAVYMAMREANITDQDPIAQGEPWPSDLFPRIEAHTRRLQKEFDALVRATDPNPSLEAKA